MRTQVEYFPLTIIGSPTYKLWRHNARRQRIWRRHLAKFGFSYVEYAVMSVLVVDMPKRPGLKQYAMRQQDLPKLLNLHKKLVAEAMTSLNKRGLVWRLDDIFDRRSFVVCATNRGKYAFELARAGLAGFDKPTA